MTIPPDFPWRPGMRILPNEAGGNRYARILTVDDGVPTCIAVEMPVGLSRDVGPWIEAWNEHAENDQDEPDLSDPATLGGLLGAVREAYGDPLAYIVPVHAKDWMVYARIEEDDIPDGVAHGLTEADALLAAWNARPVRS